MTRLQRLELTASGLGFFGVCFITWLTVWAIAPLALGWDAYVVTSNSMGPALTAGDVVVARPEARPEDLYPGRVVVIEAAPGEMPLIHRIHSTTADGALVTKGDANPRPDSTIIPTEDTAGSAVLRVPFVGLPGMWLGRGDIASIAWFGLALLLAAGAAGRILTPPPRRHNRYLDMHPIAPGWTATPPAQVQRSAQPQKPRTLLARMTPSVTIAGGLAAIALVAAPVDAAFAASSHNQASLFAASPNFGYTFYLHADPSPPTSDQTSQPILDLTENAPTGATLFNYDTDRDSFPGLFLVKGGALGGPDPTKYQRWALTAASPILIDGNAMLTVHSVVKDFETTKGATVQAGLYDCNASYSGCATIATATRTATPWSPTGTWTSRTVDFGATNYTIATGRTLVVELVVDTTSEESLWFAYDTTSYPADLTFEP